MLVNGKSLPRGHLLTPSLGVVNWDKPDTRLEWYHNASSILQAGVCVRSNQLDYDEEVMYRSTQYLYDHVRKGPNARPFCLTVSIST